MFNNLYNICSYVSKPLQLSQPGEIHKKFEAQLQKFNEELEIKKQNELKASSALIAKIFQEESLNSTNQRKLTDCEGTMLVANPGHTPYALNSKKRNCSSKSSLNLSGSSGSNVGVSSLTTSVTNESSSSAFVTPSKCNFKSFTVRLNTEIVKQTVHKAILSKIPRQLSSESIELLTVPPTNTHRAPSRNTNSADSIKLEMCHFKPIRTVPTTPTKRSSVVVLRTPTAKRIYRSQHSKNGIISPSKSCLISEKYLLASRNSAFCYVGGKPKKPIQDKLDKRSQKQSSTSIPDDTEIITRNLRNRIYKINPVIILKRCQSGNQSSNSNNSKKSNNNSTKTKRKTKTKVKSKIENKQNGIINKTEVIRRKSSRFTNAKANALLATLKTETETKIAEKFINEQKKMDSQQELLDFELAKKLQAEFDIETIRTNPRKTRRQIVLETNKRNNDRNIVKNEVPPTKKFCRNNSKKNLNLEEKGKVKNPLLTSKNNNNNINNLETSHHNLRRSKRRAAKF